MVIREQAMAWVGEHARRSGGVVTRAELEAFTYEGEQLKLINQSRGIRNPRQLQATISILSSPKGPYDDIETADGLLRYAYRSGDPSGSDNRKLRVALDLGLPLILLLEAAHILADSQGGQPVVSNGLSLCKIHHAAYDQNILGVRPGRLLTVEVRRDILDEIDGPMLRYGLQSMDGVQLQVPRLAAERPDQMAIAQRYEDFRTAAL